MLEDARGQQDSAGHSRSKVILTRSASAVVHGDRSIFEMQEVQQDDKGQTRKNSQKNTKER